MIAAAPSGLVPATLTEVSFAAGTVIDREAGVIGAADCVLSASATPPVASVPSGYDHPARRQCHDRHHA